MNTPDLVKHPTITATGTKGYLQWLKSDPGLGPVYEQNKNRIAQVLGITQNTSGYSPIVSAAEAALSGFGSLTFGKPRSRYLPTVERMPGLNGLTGLGQDDSLYSSSDILTPDNTTSDLSAANLETEVSMPDLSAVASTLPTINDTVTNSAPVTSTSATSASQLQAIIGAAATAVTTGLNISNAQQINQIQLQRAQAGLSPLNLSTVPGAAGLSSVNFGSALPLLLIAGVVLFALSSGGKRKS